MLKIFAAFLFSFVLLGFAAGENEVLWVECADCDCFKRSCDTLNVANRCKCESVCGCPEDYVLASENSNKCVPEKSCYSYCPDDMLYSGWYDPNCKTCDNPDAVCPANSPIGCYCSWGYVYDEANKKCVYPEEC